MTYNRIGSTLGGIEEVNLLVGEVYTMGHHCTTIKQIVIIVDCRVTVVIGEERLREHGIGER